VLEYTAVALGLNTVVFVSAHVVFVFAVSYQLLAVLDPVHVEVLLLEFSAKQIMAAERVRTGSFLDINETALEF